MTTRQQLRTHIRAARNALSQEQQHHASMNIIEQITNHPQFLNAQKIALYLANDGELNLQNLIENLWQKGKDTYLPVIHPFSPYHLVFIRYTHCSSMKANKFGILEPVVEKELLCPVSELDIIFTPLVAFDNTGNRLGMGGGFYDRTLAPIYENLWEKAPYIIGLAHDCQQVLSIPIESWDIPIPEIITPSQRIIC